MQFSKKSAANKKLRMILSAAVCLLLIICQCGCSGDAGDDPTVTSPLFSPAIPITSADRNTSDENAISVDLSSVDAPYTITRAGTYLLSGAMSGSVQIDAEDQIVRLIFDNVSIRSSSGPALEVLSAGKVFITLKHGTVNTLLDSGKYPTNTEADACIYSTCDLTVNGSGTLNVSGYHKDAIHSKDVLKILCSNVFIQSKRDGLHGNDGIVVSCESMTVQSERNGLHTTKTGKAGKGNVEIHASTCSIIGGRYAVSCSADLYIADSRISAMGVYDDLLVSGATSIEEGSLTHE